MPSNAVVALHACLRDRDTARFAAAIERWLAKRPDPARWERDWSSCSSVEALVQCYALVAPRPALVAALCGCARTVIGGRSPIRELEDALDVAEAFSNGTADAPALAEAIASARGAMAGARSTRRRYALNAVEAIARAAVGPRKPGRVRYEEQAASAALSLVYAIARGADREAAFDTIAAGLRTLVPCPSIELVADALVQQAAAR